jgi:hypothetical protein
MRYLTSIGLLLLFQAIVSYAIIAAGTGGGSFVGLGAMLLAGIGIPATAIVNFALIHARPAQSGFAHFSRSFLIALILPATQIALLVAVSVFRL